MCHKNDANKLEKAMLFLSKKKKKKKKKKVFINVFKVVNTGSRQNTEVKQCRARSVVGWVTAVKSWFNLPFTKTPRVVYTVAEGLAPDTGAAI
jgi:hypothetical protein